jgi:Tfp pilus assembly protein PilF
MDKKAFLFILVFPLVFISTHCASPPPKSQLHFGIYAAQRDLWDEAIFRWKKALELDPNSSAAHNNLAVAYEKKGLWEEAKKEYEVALELNPKNEYIQANYEKFKQRYQEGNGDEAKGEKDKKKK